MPKSRPSRRTMGRITPQTGFGTLAMAAFGHLSAGKALLLRHDEARSALRALGPVIYAVQTTDDLIKIGHSRDLENRLQAYGITVFDMRRLLMVRAGTVLEELMLHEHFAPYVARGHEYYRPAPEIIEYINAVRCQMGVGPMRWPSASSQSEGICT